MDAPPPPKASDAAGARGSGHPVDPWRFTGSTITKLLSRAVPDTPAHEPIPWTPVRRPLAASRVALLSTAGLSMRGDPPFDMDFERANPTRGDGSWRRIAADARSGDVVANHLHIDTRYIERDLDVALPLSRLRELVGQGRVGAMAPSHYSVMGYQGNDPSRLVEHSAPQIARSMRNEGVDLALLAPV